ncbi:MAG TPA: twin-arginine translocase subunit TatC [Sphingobacteriaceae bacterium]|nr:twin-arginine translocase subunit TatC [Sphingobacteriaceae bacterium]
MSKRSTDLIQAIKEKGKSIEAEMSFFDHLEVLRWHLVRSSIAIVVFTSLAWTYYDFIFEKVIMGPKDPNFWTYRLMCRLGEKYNLGPDFCITKIPFKIINTDMAGQFTLQLNSSLMIGIILGVPYLLFEIWRFIKPGLTDIERNSATGFTFYATFLFIIGILFGYFIMSPLSISFLANYNVSSIIENNITIDSYLSTIATLTIGSGIIFELPIIIYVLSKMGIMTPAFMRASRRYSTIIILIISAVVTPTPDLISMFTVSFPLFLLYEISIWISASVEKRRKKKDLDFYNDEKSLN